MKTVYFLPLFFLLLGNDPHPKKAESCKPAARFSSSEIEEVSPLEERASSNFEVYVRNTGDCVWKKADVHIEVKVITKPPRVSFSTASVFKERVKHQMYNDNIEKGKNGIFKIRFDPVPVPGQYGLQFTMKYKNQTLASANKYLKCED